jgi:hypothetical protein
MTNLVVCQTGSGQFASHFAEKDDPITELKLVGNDPSSERGPGITKMVLSGGKLIVEINKERYLAVTIA